ncbi:MAG: patatin family protein [Christensenellaceae bacterium]|jgi:predicted patatin/cPLA2 family phospholipase|nr:patatin family protein [Christensenellaceae bacterium]
MLHAGLVLEGGGMRGVFTAGVLDALWDEDLLFEAVYGVSAGACHACSYLSGQRGRALRTSIEFLRDSRYMSFRSLLLTGDFFGADMVYNKVPNELVPYDYDAFLRSESRFFALLTNLESGGAEAHRILDLRRQMDVIRASSSLPLLSRPVAIGGRLYLDGGVAEPIPLRRSIQDGNRKNLVVLTREWGYEKKPSNMTALRLVYGKYPAFLRAAEGRHWEYNASLALAKEERAKGSAFLLAPEEKVVIGRFERDRSRLLALYRQGYALVSGQAGAIRAFFAPD